MSSKDKFYLDSLDKLKDSGYPPVGFSDARIAPAPGDKEIIKQNNLIIELLIQVLRNQEAIQRDLKTALGNANPAKIALDDISAKIQNLSLKEPGQTSGQQVIRKQNRTMLVWKDPMELVREYEAKHPKPKK